MMNDTIAKIIYDIKKNIVQEILNSCEYPTLYEMKKSNKRIELIEEDFIVIPKDFQQSLEYDYKEDYEDLKDKSIYSQLSEKIINIVKGVNNESEPVSPYIVEESGHVEL